MEENVSSRIASVPHRIAVTGSRLIRRIKGFFFLFAADHFSHVPTGEPWNTAFGYSAEVGKAVTALAHRKYINVVLVGQEGVGTLGIAKEIARRVHNSIVHPDLKGNRVTFLHIDELFGNTSPGIHQLHVLSSIITDLERTHDTIVVITGMKNVFAGKYRMRPADILHPFFSASIRTITILSDTEYEEYVAHDSDLSHLVEVIPIHSLSPRDAKIFLKDVVGESISPQAIDELVDATEDLFPRTPYPKRAFDILEEVQSHGEPGSGYIAKVISQRVGIDITRPKASHEKGIEALLRASVVDQDEAIEKIGQACMHARGRKNSKHPIVSLLFTGPQGVGKTETATTLADAYFGSRNRVVAVDMAADTADLYAVVADNPFHVILLQNITKISSEGQKDLRTLTQDGYVKDRFGNMAFATHHILVARAHEEAIPPEISELFDEVITFEPLSKKSVDDIVHRKLSKLSGELQREHDSSLVITDVLIAYIAEHGYTQEYGATGMDTLVHHTVEHAISELIRKGTLIPGQPIQLDPKKFE